MNEQMKAWATKFNPRRPYEDDKPDGRLESDMDFMDNNRWIIIEFLEMLESEMLESINIIMEAK